MRKPKRREKKIKREEKKSYWCQIKPSQFIQATQVWKKYREKLNITTKDNA
jgi:hypothetical protein